MRRVRCLQLPPAFRGVSAMIRAGKVRAKYSASSSIFIRSVMLAGLRKLSVRGCSIGQATRFRNEASCDLGGPCRPPNLSTATHLRSGSAPCKWGETSDSLHAAEQNSSPLKQQLCQSMEGSLMHAMVGTRPKVVLCISRIDFEPVQFRVNKYIP